MSRLTRLCLTLSVTIVFCSANAGAQGVASIAGSGTVEALAYRLPASLHDGETWADSDVTAFNPASDVASIRPANRRDRTVLGVVIGGLAGAFLGVSAGAMYDFVYGGNGAVIGLAGGAAFGAGVGALLGHAYGRDDPPQR